MVRTNVMLWLGSVFAGFTAAAFFAVAAPDQRTLWAPVVGASAVFAFIALASGPTRWAAVSIPGAVLTMLALNYARLNPSDPVAITLLVATLTVGAAYAWSKRGSKHTHLRA